MSDVQDYRKDRLDEINKINELNLPEEDKKSLIRKALKDALKDPKIQKAQTEKRFFRESKAQIKKQQKEESKTQTEKKNNEIGETEEKKEITIQSILTDKGILVVSNNRLDRDLKDKLIKESIPFAIKTEVLSQLYNGSKLGEGITYHLRTLLETILVKDYECILKVLGKDEIETTLIDKNGDIKKIIDNNTGEETDAVIIYKAGSFGERIYLKNSSSNGGFFSYSIEPRGGDMSFRHDMDGARKYEEDFNKMVKNIKKLFDNCEKIDAPQLEKKNHKIDEGKSKKEKLAEGWNEEEMTAIINSECVKIKVLKKELAPGAFVREYQDDGKVPKHLVGEQLFNWKAVLSLGLQDRLPTWEDILSNKRNDYQEFLKNNFQKNGKNLFVGEYNSSYELLGNLGDKDNYGWYWLSDGDCMLLDEYNIKNKNDTPSKFGLSLRLLKK